MFSYATNLPTRGRGRVFGSLVLAFQYNAEIMPARFNRSIH